MVLIGNILFVILGIALIAVPGFFFTRAFLGRQSAVETIVLSASCGTVVIGVLSYSVALALRVPVSILLLALTALVVVIVALAVIKFGKIEVFTKGESDHQPPSFGDPWLAVMGMLLPVVFTLNLFDPGVEHACINAVVLDAVSKGGSCQQDEPPGTDHSDGSTAPDPAGGTMDLIDRTDTGQRYGTTALIAPFVALYGLMGFGVFYVLLQWLLAAHVYLLIHRHLGNPRLALVVALIAVLNPAVFKITAAEENVMSAMLVAAVLFLSLTKPDAPAIIGLFTGAAIGVRHINLALLPAVALYLWWQGMRDIRSRFVCMGVFLLTACVGTLPCVLHHQAAYGSILSHEHFVDEVFHSAPHTFLGWTFQHTGLLNFPFYSHLIRTPYNPFPTFLYYPLSVMTHIGLLLSAAIVVGIGPLFRRDARLFGMLILWSAPIWTLLSVIEDWMDPVKMNIAVMLFPLFMLMLASGLEALWTSRKTRLGWILLVTLIFIGVRSARQLDFPADERAYEKYAEMRREHPAYLDLEKARYTRGNFFPDLSRTGSSGLPMKMRMAAAVLSCPSSDSGSTVLSLSLEEPLIRNRRFLEISSEVDDAPDLSEEGIVLYRGRIHVSWADIPAEILIRKEMEDLYSVRLRFGDMPYADLFDESPGTARFVPPNRLDSHRFHFRLPQKATILVSETVNDHDTFVYSWLYSLCGGRLRNIFFAEKMLHT